MLRLEQANTQHTPSSLKNKHTMTSTNTIKFLCSFGGKILPRYPDGNLRYHGGQTRLLSVNRSISFNELMTKLGELCETTVCLRCQLPTEDLDALVLITCDEDLNNLIEEYDLYAAKQGKSIKIRAFLSLPKRSTLSGSPSSSAVGSCSSGSSTATQEAGSPKSSITAPNRCVYRVAKQPVRYNGYKGNVRCHMYGSNNRSYLVHNGNYWQ